MKMCAIYNFCLPLRRQRQREGVEGVTGLKYIQTFPAGGNFASQDSTRECGVLAWVLPSSQSGWYTFLEMWQPFVAGHAHYVR